MDIHNSRASEFGGRVPLPFARSQPGRSEGDGFAGGWSPWVNDVYFSGFWVVFKQRPMSPMSI